MTPATTRASRTGESSTAKGSAPGRRTASRSFSSHSTVWPGFSGISEMSGYMASGSRPAALQIRDPALQDGARDRGHGRAAARAAPADRKAHMIDVFGQVLFQGKGHGPGELDAAAGGQFGLRQ